MPGQGRLMASKPDTSLKKPLAPTPAQEASGTYTGSVVRIITDLDVEPATLGHLSNGLTSDGELRDRLCPPSLDPRQRSLVWAH
jgi:hypothetical protein